MKSEIYIDLDGQSLVKTTYVTGTIHYINKQGHTHRLDGPAVGGTNGYQAWYINGKLHREDGPAEIYPDGSEYWYKNGNGHRLDGPAYIDSDGTVEYWLNGERVSRKYIDLLWLKKQMEE